MVGLEEIDEDFAPFPCDSQTLASELEYYRSSHLAEHLAALEPAEVLKLIDEEAFLVDQVKNLGSYAPAARTLSQLALPLARGERFLRLAATGLSLQRLATRLDDEPTARAMLKLGQSDLITGLADQLKGAADRARIWALLAAADPHHKLGASWRQQVSETVDSLFDSASPLTAPDLSSLGTILRELAPELISSWSRWQKSPKLQPTERNRLRLSLLEGLWRRGFWSESRGREEAASHPSPGEVGLHLASALLASPARRFDLAAGCLLPWIDDDPERAWRAVSATGGQLGLHDRQAALAWWRCFAARVPPARLIDEEALRLLWQLDPPALRRLADIAEEPAQAALIALPLLFREGTPAHLQAARDAVAAIPDPARHFLATLLLVGAAAPIDSQLARRLLRAIGVSLEKAEYRCSVRWLVIYLEEIAALETRALRRELHEVVFAAHFTAEALLELASRITSPELWEAFFEGIERFAIAATANQLAGFELRAKVLAELGRGLTQIPAGLDRLDRLTERQLLEEEEELRLELATLLADQGRIAEGRRIVSKLPAGPIRRLADIRLKATEASHLDAAELFSALSDATSLEDELWGLKPLLLAPIELEEILERDLGQIANPDTRSLCVLRLLQHRAAFETKNFGRLRDARSLLEMARPLLVIEDEQRLAALIPELVAAGALAGSKTWLAELLESTEGLFRLDRLDPQSLREAFEGLLLAGCGTGDPEKNRDHLQSFYAALLRLPNLFGDGDEARAAMLPALLAPLVGALERRAPAKVQTFLVRLGKNWRLDQQPWPTLLAWCRAAPESRPQRIGAWLERPDPHPALLEAATFLLPQGPLELLETLLDRLPPGRQRNRLVFRLVASGWVAPRSCGARLLRSLDDEALQRLAWLYLHRQGAAGDDVFLHHLEDAVAHGLLDSTDPAIEPILRRLWRCAPAKSEASLGRAVLSAFERGAEPTDRAIRLWLHALLAPRPGEEQLDKAKLWNDLYAATGRARRLDYQPREPR